MGPWRSVQHSDRNDFFRHWGTDNDGKKRSVSETTLEPPLGSGPYRVKEFAAGRSIVYERVKNYCVLQKNCLSL